jgi:hypothetical protein
VNFSVTGLFLELALILMPGFIWMRIHVKYGAPAERTSFDIVLNAFIFGVVAYGVLFAIDRVSGAQFHLLDLDLDAKKLDPGILIDAFWALVIALVGSVVFLYIENYKIITRFLQLIGTTGRFGDEDVWDFTFNSKGKLTFVHVRDFAKGAVFSGFAKVYSESGQIRELYLEDVIVYDLEGNEQYRVEALYIARDRDDITVEFPALPAPGVSANAE